MSQEFSFPNLFIGLLRLSSSRAVHDPEAVQDPELIARFIHQMTGNENQYVPPPPAAAAAAVPTAVSTPTASLAVAGDPYGHPIHEVASLRIFGSRKSWAQRWNGLDE